MTMKITIEHKPIGIEFEVGSLKELIGILEEQDTELRRIATLAVELSGSGTAPIEQTTTAQGDGKKPRGRPSTKDKAPESAAAPAPIPVPGANPPAPDTTIGENGLPKFLDRTSAVPAPLAPPPAPTLPAPIPPSGVLAGRIIADLDKRKPQSLNGGQDLADWIASSGLTRKGATYDEVIAVLRMTADDKLADIAKGLSLAD